YTTSAHRELNLYEIVGSRCREATKDEADQVRLAIGVLQKLFRRPIFLREVRECGFSAAIEAPQAPREEREEARRGLVKLGLQLRSLSPPAPRDRTSTSASGPAPSWEHRSRLSPPHEDDLGLQGDAQPPGRA